MFSLQEYQHVHLLWFKKRSFTLVWKPNPPLCSIRCTHLALVLTWRVKAQWACAAPALHTRRLLPLRVQCETGVNQALLKRSRWKRLSLRDQWNLSPATMCWQRALYEEQRRPCTRTSANTPNFCYSLESCYLYLPIWYFNCKFSWSLHHSFTVR